MKHKLLKIDPKTTIPISSICMLAALNSYTRVYAFYPVSSILTEYLMSRTIKVVHAQVPELIRTHRSYAIAPRHFVKLTVCETHKDNQPNGKITMRGQVEVPVSIPFLQSVQKALNI